MLDDIQRGFIEENFNLCYACAHRHIRSNGALHKAGWTFDDLVSLASAAMCSAVEAFDPSKGYKFTTLFYRVWDNAVAEQIRRMYTKKRRSTEGATVSFDQLAFEGNWEAVPGLYSGDLDTPEDRIIEIEGWRLIRECIERLPKKQRDMVVLYYAGYNQNQIAERIGVTQAYVSRALRKAYKRLHDMMSAVGYEQMEA